MKARSLDCCHRARPRRRGWSRGAAGGVVFAVLATLTPKCPLCLAAWLGVIGLSGLAARVDARALWLGAAVAAALVVGFGGAAFVPRFLRRAVTNSKGEAR